MKALIISADSFEDTELLVPYYRLKEERIDVIVSSMRKGRIKGKHGYEVGVDKTLADIQTDKYQLLLLPGGKAPENIRNDIKAQEIVRRFFGQNKTVAAICHGPQILISSGVMKGRRATCYRSVAKEMTDAGAEYIDREVVIDRNLVTSRQPSDLPFFLRELIRMIRSL